MFPQDLFVHGKNNGPKVGYESVEPTQRPRSETSIRIDQLWKERDDIIERALDRGEFTDEDYYEMELIEAEIKELEEQLAAYHGERTELRLDLAVENLVEVE